MQVKSVAKLLRCGAKEQRATFVSFFQKTAAVNYSQFSFQTNFSQLHKLYFGEIYFLYTYFNKTKYLLSRQSFQIIYWLLDSFTKLNYFKAEFYASSWLIYAKHNLNIHINLLNSWQLINNHEWYNLSSLDKSHRTFTFPTNVKVEPLPKTKHTSKSEWKIKFWEHATKLC